MKCHMKPCGPKYIPIYRGDDTDFQGNRKIYIVIDTDQDLTGFTAYFSCAGINIEKSFGPIPESRELEIVFTEEETKNFKLGFWDAVLFLRDPEGKKKTLDNRIGIHVTNSPKEAYCLPDDRKVCVHLECPIFYDDLRGKPTLNGVVIEGDKTSKDYHITGGGGGTDDYNDLENKPKLNGKELKGNVELTGSDIMKDDSGVSETVADAIISLGTTIGEHVVDNSNPHNVTAEQVGTYNKSEIDDKITRFVAHYLTDRVNGRFVPFATHAALAAAKTAHTEQNPRFFYAGHGFTPTKNDYCVVLADETVENKTTRYSFVGDWPTGSFQYQYTINDTAFSQAQWDAINSGITAELIRQFGAELEEKQDKLAVDLDGTYHIQVSRALGSDEAGFATNAEFATKAEQDESGRSISGTYATKLSDTTVGKIDEESHDDNITVRMMRVPIEFARKSFNGVKVEFHSGATSGTGIYMAVGYSHGDGGSGASYTDVALGVSTNSFLDTEVGNHVYLFDRDYTKDIPADAKFLTFFFSTNRDKDSLAIRNAPIETGYATTEEETQKKYQVQQTAGFFIFDHAPLMEFLVVDDEVARKSNVASVADKVTEISATVSTNNRFLVNGTTAAIQTREDEESDWADEIHLDKGYDALQGDAMVKLDKSVQTVTVNGGTLEVVFPEGVDGTVRDLCLYVNNTSSESTVEMTFPDGTYYGADGWDAAAQKGGITGYYFSEIPGSGWRVSREELNQFVKGA